MGLGAGSSTASPQVTLACSWVTMFLLLVGYHGSCHHEAWLIELKKTETNALGFWLEACLGSGFLLIFLF